MGFISIFGYRNSGMEGLDVLLKSGYDIKKASIVHSQLSDLLNNHISY